MSDFPLAEGENLSWELRNQAADSGEIGEGTYDPLPFPFWPEDPDQEISLQVSLSLNQYVALMSAIDIGAAIAYGGDSLRVKWFLWRNFQGDAMSFCSQVIGCVETDTDTQDAITGMLETNDEFRDFLSEYIAEHPDGSTVGKNQPIPETTKITTTDGCDLDVLWAQCRGIVETSNQFVMDFIEKWEVYTNKGEVVSDMLNAVPLLAELVSASGVSGVLEYANDLVDAIGENYLADYDETYEITLACELFCRAQLNPDCVLTIGQIAGIMNDRISNSLSLGNVIELIVSLTDHDITGINVADLYICFFFNALQIGNIVLPVEYGFETFVNIVGVINEPSDDWVGLCEECPTPEALNIIPAPSFDAWTSEYIETDINGHERWRLTRNFNTGFAACVMYDPSHYFRIISNEIVEGAFTNQVAWVTYPSPAYGENYTGVYPDDITVYSFYRWPDGAMPQVFDVILEWAGNYP